MDNGVPGYPANDNFGISAFPDRGDSGDDYVGGFPIGGNPGDIWFNSTWAPIGARITYDIERTGPSSTSSTPVEVVIGAIDTWVSGSSTFESDPDFFKQIRNFKVRWPV